jgi:hypothetical protein
MMTWNYRVIEFISGEDRWRAIHEVFYNSAGKPTSYGERAAIVGWDVVNGDESAVHILERMQIALTLPVLSSESDFHSS